MFGFFDKNVRYDIGINELIMSLTEKRKYRLHWKWLHDQLIFWNQKLNESELFEKNEIDIILPLLVPFLYKIFNQHKTHCRKTFINLIEKDIQARYENASDWQWNYILNKEGEELTSESSLTEKQDLNFLQENQNIGVNPNVAPTEEYQTFFRKINYLLDLLIPNNFQYAIYKSAFESSKIFEIKEHSMKYPLYFPTKFFKRIIEEKKTIAAKARITRTLKKEDDLNVQVGEVEYIVKPINKDAIYKLIMPLNMANEAMDVWEDIKEELNDAKQNNSNYKQEHKKRFSIK